MDSFEIQFLFVISFGGLLGGALIFWISELDKYHVPPFHYDFSRIPSNSLSPLSSPSIPRSVSHTLSSADPSPAPSRTDYPRQATCHSPSSAKSSAYNECKPAPSIYPLTGSKKFPDPHHIPSIVETYRAAALYGDPFAHGLLPPATLLSQKHIVVGDELVLLWSHYIFVSFIVIVIWEFFRYCLYPRSRCTCHNSKKIRPQEDNVQTPDSENTRDDDGTPELIIPRRLVFKPAVQPPPSPTEEICCSQTPSQISQIIPISNIDVFQTKLPLHTQTEQDPGRDPSQTSSAASLPDYSPHPSLHTNSAFGPGSAEGFSIPQSPSNDIAVEDNPQLNTPRSSQLNAPQFPQSELNISQSQSNTPQSQLITAQSQSNTPQSPCLIAPASTSPFHQSENMLRDIATSNNMEPKANFTSESSQDGTHLNIPESSRSLEVAARDAELKQSPSVDIAPREPISVSVEFDIPSSNPITPPKQTIPQLQASPPPARPAVAGTLRPNFGIQPMSTLMAVLVAEPHIASTPDPSPSSASSIIPTLPAPPRPTFAIYMGKEPSSSSAGSEEEMRPPQTREEVKLENQLLIHRLSDFVEERRRRRKPLLPLSEVRGDRDELSPSASTSGLALTAESLQRPRRVRFAEATVRTFEADNADNASWMPTSWALENFIEVTDEVTGEVTTRELTEVERTKRDHLQREIDIELELFKREMAESGTVVFI